MDIEIIDIVLLIAGILLVIVSGIFDSQKDYAKSNIQKWTDPELWAEAPWYMFSGSSKNSGWRFKWKDGLHTSGEAFPGSSTVFVFVTDWFHMAKKLQILFMTLGLIAMAYFHPLTIFGYETINHIGFQLGTKHYEKTSKFVWWFQRLGYRLFLINMNKHNKNLLYRYKSGEFS